MNRRLPMDRSLWPAIFLLIATFVLFEVTDLDLWVQDHLYDFTAKAWLVDARSTIPRLLFYTGPKSLIFAFGFFLMGVCCASRKWREKLVEARFQRRDLLVVLATLITAPSLISVSKATTNVFCPYEVRHYGGDNPYEKVCESYPPDDHPSKRGRGFPAGHASGGFALLSLAGLARSRRGIRIGIAIGLGVGTIMGAYQMFKGAHYLSHTLITAMFCWIVFLLWRRILCRAPAAASPETSNSPLPSDFHHGMS